MKRFSIETIDAVIPFEFHYDGVPFSIGRREWPMTEESFRLEDSYLRKRWIWKHMHTSLHVECVMTLFDDFPAAEWLLRFTNEGTRATPIVSDVRDMDLKVKGAMADGSFILHKLNGAPSNPTDYEPSAVVIRPGETATLSSGEGRSSNKDFPFFRIDTREGCFIIAVGWSGQWQAELKTSPREQSLHIRIGLERTHFCLFPGESVRGCRILVLEHHGNHDEAHSQFRRLIWKHYASRAHGAGSISQQPIMAGRHQGRREPLPVAFCNTCFTRGGNWLNECNAQNQISLIRALAPLGIQGVITDAGWFKGGWPHGVGNWEYDPEKYPQGMEPVAAAAKEHGMSYGLWFEPERVGPGTQLEQEHAPWLLRSEQTKWGCLVDFGLDEVQDYFMRLVEKYLSLPGMGIYRQDFNISPLPFWRDNDAPNRQGIHEMKYIEGLYKYWDRIRAAFPGVFMEECASGGRRIDLETVMRFQTHQKSDYWFDNLVDQATLFALSAYLPNATISAPLQRLDTYSFLSTLPSSLVIGWAADEPGFDMTRAKEILCTYRSVRHLLVGDWYGLTPWSRASNQWLVSQYHREDLGEGMILAFRRENCDSAISVRPNALHRNTRYVLKSLVTGQERHETGASLMDGMELRISEAPGADLIVYQESNDGSQP